MVHKGTSALFHDDALYKSTFYLLTYLRAVSTGRLTVSSFELAWFSSLSSNQTSVSSVFIVLYIF